MARRARKPPKKPLKKNQYRTVGGPVDRLYLPGVEIGEYKTPLPQEVRFPGDGSYALAYDPEGDNHYYTWSAS